MLVGIPALRLSGFYLALATFGIAVVLPTILKKFDDLTGGSTGITLFGKPTQTGHGFRVTILGRHLTNNEWLYALTWTIGVALFLRRLVLLDSRFGRSLRAVRDSELAAAASGVNRSTYKVAAFGVSAAFAGVGGSLLAINVAYVSPDTFPIQLSLYLLVGAVVGFFGSIWGAVLGALLIQFLPDLVHQVPQIDDEAGGPDDVLLRRRPDRADAASCRSSCGGATTYKSGLPSCAMTRNLIALRCGADRARPRRHCRRLDDRDPRRLLLDGDDRLERPAHR